MTRSRRARVRISSSSIIRPCRVRTGRFSPCANRRGFSEFSGSGPLSDRRQCHEAAVRERSHPTRQRLCARYAGKVSTMAQNPPTLTLPCEDRDDVRVGRLVKRVPTRLSAPFPTSRGPVYGRLGAQSKHRMATIQINAGGLTGTGSDLFGDGCGVGNAVRINRPAVHNSSCACAAATRHQRSGCGFQPR